MKKNEYTVLEKYKEHKHLEEESEKNVIKGFDMLFIWSAVFIFVVIALKGFGSGSMSFDELGLFEVLIIGAGIYLVIGYPLILLVRIVGEMVMLIYHNSKAGKLKKQMWVNEKGK